MKYFEWNAAKNEIIKIERGISFEDVITAIFEGKELDKTAHPNKQKYPHQQIMVVEINEYVYLVPFVEDEEKVFLKTAFRSRKIMKNRLRSPKNETT